MQQLSVFCGHGASQKAAGTTQRSLEGRVRVLVVKQRLEIEILLPGSRLACTQDWFDNAAERWEGMPAVHRAAGCHRAHVLPMPLRVRNHDCQVMHLPANRQA